MNSPPSSRRLRPSARFWYLAGMCPYFCAIGIQNVVIIWLLTQVLHESPSRVGFAQMLTMLPMLTVILLGGVVADRRELRRLLISLQLVMALLPLTLSGLIFAGLLSYAALVSISVSIGVLGAFIVPARDAMLSVVDDGELHRTVTAMTGLQFTSQIAGLLLGGSADWLAARLGAGPLDPRGAAALLLLQGVLIGAAALTSAGLQASGKPQTDSNERSALRGILEGFEAAKVSDVIRPVLVLLFLVGAVFTSIFLVQIPLMVREVYHGGSKTLANLSICFMGGAALAALILRRTPPLRRQGRAILLACGVNGVVMAVVSTSPPLPLLLLLAVIWGSCGSLTIMISRTLVQAAAPAPLRGRILSIYQLSFAGGAPFGSFAMGLIIGPLGVAQAALVPAIGMAVILSAACIFSGLWRLRY